ncbi:hypothetical protein ACFCZR_19340, partial [Streptomyces rubiginosohelvolus]
MAAERRPEPRFLPVPAPDPACGPSADRRDGEGAYPVAWDARVVLLHERPEAIDDVAVVTDDV